MLDYIQEFKEFINNPKNMPKGLKVQYADTNFISLEDDTLYINVMQDNIYQKNNVLKFDIKILSTHEISETEFIDIAKCLSKKHISSKLYPHSNDNKIGVYINLKKDTGVFESGFPLLYPNPQLDPSPKK